MRSKIFQDETDVLKYQRERLKNISETNNKFNSDLDALEIQLQKYLSEQGIENIASDKSTLEKTKDYVEIKKDDIKKDKTFDDLKTEAREKGYENFNLEEVATNEEIKETHFLLNKYYNNFSDEYKLDKYDYAISGIVGTLAALIDYFIVTNVNGKKVSSGKMKSGVEKLWQKLLSDQKIETLEKKYKVCYDISTNTSKISKEVLGLCPGYHRFQSLGHDPILGFIFGVSNLIKGELTAIDANGRLIIQSLHEVEGENIIKSIITVFGHFLSDVATKSNGGKILSVPAPLTPLLQLVQVGAIEYNNKKYTVGDLSKKMYGDGYNFNHFLGMSIPVFIIEVLVRLSFVIKEIFIEKNDIELKNNPKLNIMLCISNGILFSENVGKLVISKNPFSINYVSWIVTAKYGFKTLKWIMYDREIGKIKHAQEYLNANWRYLELSSNRYENIEKTFYID